MANSFDQFAKSLSKGMRWHRVVLSLFLLAYMALGALLPFSGVVHGAGKGNGPPLPNPACDHVPDQARDNLPPLLNCTGRGEQQ